MYEGMGKDSFGPYIANFKIYCAPQSQSQSQSYITTDSQLASPSWCQAPIYDQRPIYLSPWNFL
jgi:hypothetical protein